MKTISKLTLISVLFGSFFFVLTGCNNRFLDEPMLEIENSRVSLVSMRIGELYETGLFNSLTHQSARVTSSLGSFCYYLEVDMEKLKLFIYNTDEALYEIAQLENGDVHLRLIEALFTGGTVGEVADIMAEISEEMANNYLIAIEGILSYLVHGDEAVACSALLDRNARDIRLGFFSEKQYVARGPFSARLDQATVNWYIGFSAATIAGVIAASARLPWVSIPGRVAAIAGAGSMALQLGQWYRGTPLRNFINGLANRNPAAVYNVFRNTPYGTRILAIAGATTLVATAISFSPFGRLVTTTIRGTWNSFVARIAAGLPPHMTLTILRIPIRPI